MAKITKPDMTYVWASGGSKTAPSNVKIQTGWIVEKPEFEKMNWVQAPIRLWVEQLRRLH